MDVKVYMVRICAYAKCLHVYILLIEIAFSLHFPFSFLGLAVNREMLQSKIGIVFACLSIFLQ